MIIEHSWWNRADKFGKGGNNAEEIQTIQHTLATVMEKIQNRLMQDGDLDEDPSVEEMPAFSESIPT